MDHEQVGQYWNANADVWTKLSRAGYDVHRDHLNTPAFLEMLPDVTGRSGLDIGCGEGHNTRMLARRGARMTAVDIAETFIGHAMAEEQRQPLGIEYRVASAVALPFPDGAFDFATAFMSFMDIPETAKVMSEAYRVLKPGAFLQFSICHPCYDTPHRRALQDATGKTYALEIGDYFRNQQGEIEEWLFSDAPAETTAGLPRFQIPRFTRTLSQWVNGLLDAGFTLDRLGEPKPGDDAVRAHPRLQETQAVAYYLHVRAKKPGPAPLAE